MEAVVNAPDRVTRVVFRDVTITNRTRDDLAELLEWLEQARLRYWEAAVREVVTRWDENDATEVGITGDV